MESVKTQEQKLILTQPHSSFFFRNQQRTLATGPKYQSFHAISGIFLFPNLATLIQIRRRPPGNKPAEKAKQFLYSSHKNSLVCKQLRTHCSRSLEFPACKLKNLAINSSICFVSLSMKNLVFDTGVICKFRSFGNSSFISIGKNIMIFKIVEVQLGQLNKCFLHISLY